jgi:hypothetical protein
VARRCTVCDHPERDKIDRQLINGEVFQTIADNSRLSATALKNHKAKHIPVSLVQAHREEEASWAGKILADIAELRQLTRRLLEEAITARDRRIYPQFLRELREQIKLLVDVHGMDDLEKRIAALEEAQDRR